MLQDTMESMDDDEIEEEAEEEVNKVLFQITDGNVCRILLRHFMYNVLFQYSGWKLTDTHTDYVFIIVGLLGEAPLAAGSLPTEAEEEEEEPALDDMQRRLEALKS